MNEKEEIKWQTSIATGGWVKEEKRVEGGKVRRSK